MIKGATAMYRLRSGDGRLLYVGITDCMYVRCGKHRRETRWWPQVERIEQTWYKFRTHAQVAEEMTIRNEKPAHNIVFSNQGPMLQPIFTPVVLSAKSLDADQIRSAAADLQGLGQIAGVALSAGWCLADLARFTGLSREVVRSALEARRRAAVRAAEAQRRHAD